MEFKDYHATMVVNPAADLKTIKIAYQLLLTYMPVLF